MIDDLQTDVRLDIANRVKQIDRIGKGDLPLEMFGGDQCELTKRFKQLFNHVNSKLLHREKAIELILASLISGVPMVIFGPPGTAKSFIINEICRAIEARSFKLLMTDHTMPEELFGAPIIQELVKGTFVRRFEGMIPESDIVFLDEVFRGGSQILNTLLSVVNERRFHEGGDDFRIPLMGIIGAANDPPHQRGLEAFYDRFPIRLWVASVMGGAQDASIQDTGLELLDRATRAERANGSKIMSWKDLWAIRCGVREKLEGDQGDKRASFVELFCRIREVQRSQGRGGASLSDRALAQIWKFACALNWIRASRGDKKASMRAHLDVFRYVGASSEESKFCEREVDRYQPRGGLNGEA